MSRLYLALALLAVFGTATGAAYLKGRSVGRAVDAEAAAGEVQRLNEVIRLAGEAARSREAARLAEMERLEATVEQLRGEADEDPDADRPAVGPDSVRRINSVN